MRTVCKAEPFRRRACMRFEASQRMAKKEEKALRAAVEQAMKLLL